MASAGRNMAEDTEEKVGTARMIALILLAIASLACLIAGGTPYAMAIETWVDKGYIFQGFELIDWLVGLIGAAIVAAGLLLAGIVLRLLRWRHASFASLLLSAVSAAFLVATFVIYSQTGHGENSIEVVLLQALCIVGLFVIALPPFLHWLFAKRRPATADLPKVS
jgi:hypothetical protein